MENITEAVKEINNLSFDKEDTLDEMMEMFYSVCRKYKIKQGYSSETGRICDTTEWTILRMAFEKSILNYFEFFNLLEEPPKDLME